MKPPTLISKGDKGTSCDTTLKAYWTGDVLNLDKRFVCLMLSKKQANDLRDWLIREKLMQNLNEK